MMGHGGNSVNLFLFARCHSKVSLLPMRYNMEERDNFYRYYYACVFYVTWCILCSFT
jgi:hypothetical protein